MRDGKKDDDPILFEGTLNNGDTFTIRASDVGKDELKGDVKFYDAFGNEIASLHTSCSQPLGVGTVAGDFEVTAGLDKDGIPLCDAPPAPECAECKGGVIQLTLKYTGPDAAEVKIVAKDVEYNLGVLQPGEIFTINGTKDDGKFEKNDLEVYFDGVKQDVKIHVSCSQPIGEGVVFTFGDGRELTVVESFSRDFPDLAVCPVMDLAALGDFVWRDLNADGLQDAGEPGIEGVTVNLLDPNNGFSVLETTTTDADGLYGFSGLMPGDYTVEFVKPADHVFSPKDAGDDALDSDADTATGRTDAVTLAAGDENLTLDAGLYRTASLGDFVWDDLNGDGLQDAGEPGVEGVTVNLYDGDGNLVGTTTTDADGLYAFTDLAPGDYVVEFVLPGGFVFTTKDAGDDALDSDADAATGRTDTVTLAAGEDNLTLDAGLVVPVGSLGDYVWEDLDLNGLQGADEPGIEGITVNLLDPNNGFAVLETTTTNADGFYLFPDLDPGDYVVEFVTPDTLVFTGKDAGDDALDSDADETTGRTDTITLAAGENNLTVDAGMVSVCLFDTGPPEIDYAGDFDVASDSGTVTITVTDDTGLASVDLVSFEAFGDLTITLDCTDDFFVGTKKATYVCAIPDPTLFYFVTVVATDLCGQTPDCPNPPYHPIDNPNDADKPPLVYGPGLSNGIFPIFIEARGATLKAVDVFLLVDADFADSTVTEIPGPEFTFDPGVADFQFDLVKTGGGFRWGFLAADQCNATIADPESGDPVSIRSDRVGDQTLNGELSGAVAEELPTEFALNQNYPNPFNPTTQIRFDLPEASRVTLAVYDVLGRRVMTLADGAYAPGRHTVTFDGRSLSSGMYFYRLITDRQTFTKTMILQK